MKIKLVCEVAVTDTQIVLLDSLARVFDCPRDRVVQYLLLHGLAHYTRRHGMDDLAEAVER